MNSNPTKNAKTTVATELIIAAQMLDMIPNVIDASRRYVSALATPNRRNIRAHIPTPRMAGMGG
jgi:hypothetical protein